MMANCTFRNDGTGREWIANCETLYQNPQIYNIDEGVDPESGVYEESEQITPPEGSSEMPDLTQGGNPEKDPFDTILDKASSELDQAINWFADLPIGVVGLVLAGVAVVLITLYYLRTESVENCTGCSQLTAEKDPFGRPRCSDCTGRIFKSVGTEPLAEGHDGGYWSTPGGEELVRSRL